MVIHGFEGILSSGKTLEAVKKGILHSYQREKKLISNIVLNKVEYTYFPDNKLIDFIRDNYNNPEKIRNFFYNSVFIVDELTNLIESRRSTTELNLEILRFFMMLGKLNCDLFFTAQFINEYSQVDVRLRELCLYTYSCKRFSDTGKWLIDEDRKLAEKIIIVMEVTLWYNQQEPLKWIEVDTDTEQWFSFYDTTEIMMLDRSKYLKK